jgi:hypothetical protein
VRPANHHCLAVDDCHCGDGRANDDKSTDHNHDDHDDDDNNNDTQYDHAANYQYDHAADNDNAAAADNDGVVVHSVLDKFWRPKLDAVVPLLSGQLPGIACKLHRKLLLHIAMPPRSRHLYDLCRDNLAHKRADNDDTNGDNDDNGDISDSHNDSHNDADVDCCDDLGNNHESCNDNQRDNCGDPRGNEHKHICNSCRDDDDSCGHDDRNRFENGDNIADDIVAAADNNNDNDSSNNNSDDDGDDDDRRRFNDFKPNVFCGNDVCSRRHDNFGARSPTFFLECQCRLLAAIGPPCNDDPFVNGDFSFRFRVHRRTRADRPTVATVHWISDKSMPRV